MKALLITALVLVTSMLPCQPAGAAEIDYLKIVKDYVTTLIEDGRDSYGKEHSPLFATCLDRSTLKLFDEAGLKRIWRLRLDDWDNWRIRNRDRVLLGANPMHDQELYQILYALTVLTGDARYAEEADTTLKWFFEHCQSETTGLFAWGEHMGWDFNTEDIIRKKTKHYGGQLLESETHEFARPWALWERSFKLAPEACQKFAVGLWKHQISDQNTGSFSRHANYSKHQTFTDSKYPRHGGFFIATWAEAYRHTQDVLFVKAIDTLLTYFEKSRSQLTGAIPAATEARFGARIVYAMSNLSLAIDLSESAKKVPEALGDKMRRLAATIDDVYFRLAHDVGPDAGADPKGLLENVYADTLRPASKNAYIPHWNDAGAANRLIVRYEQSQLENYRSLALQLASAYLNEEPVSDSLIHPGEYGDLIEFMLGAFKLSDDARYLAAAERFAELAHTLFLGDGRPLPKATVKYDHYEAVSRADILMKSFLHLWAVKSGQDGKINFELTWR